MLRRINGLRSQQVQQDVGLSMCALCYSEYAPEEEVRALPCLHFYHCECIDQWLIHDRMCSICQHIVAPY